jgi:hypothetical protein
MRQNQINALKLPKSMSIRPVLIHINGITSDLEDTDYFANIIDFGEVFR